MNDKNLTDNGRFDADALDNIAQGMTYNGTDSDAVAKHRLREIAMRLRTGFYVRAASSGAAAATAGVPSGYALVPLEPTPEMIAAYLKANDAYWKRTDELPATNPSRWRQGTPGEATAESYRALLDAAPASSPTVGAVQGKEAAPPPLTGTWHHGQGFLVCGTIRVAHWDCDTNPPVEFRDAMLEWMCATLNAAVEFADLAGNEAGRGLTDLAGVAGEALGLGYPDWPADLSTFEERKAYQRGVAHARAIERELSPSTPAADFDAWMTSPYTEVLMRSVSEDYVPRADLTSTPAAGAGVAEATERNIPHGWALYIADFSVRAARGRTYDGRVFLVRDEAGRRGWHLLSEAEQKANPLYVSGNGKTFADALGRAIHAALASTPQAASPTHPEGQA